MRWDEHGCLSVLHHGHGPPYPVRDVLISTKPYGRDMRTRVLVNEILIGS